MVTAQSPSSPLCLAGGRTQSVKVGPLGVEPQTGGLASISNPFTGTEHRLVGWHFEIQPGDRSPKSEAAQKVNMEQGAHRHDISTIGTGHRINHVVSLGSEL